MPRQTARSEMVEKVRQWLDDEIGTYNFEGIAPRLIAFILNNLPREVMASLINGMTSLPMPSSLALADRLIDELKHEVLGHD